MAIDPKTAIREERRGTRNNRVLVFQCSRCPNELRVLASNYHLKRCGGLCNDCKLQNARSVSEKRGFFSSANQSRRRKGHILVEAAMQEELRLRGYEVFAPTVVCDAVVVKDGKVFFAEFKSRGQKLRPGQQRISDVAPKSYLVFYEEDLLGE